MKSLLVILILILIPLATAEGMRATVTMTPVAEQEEKKIYEDNPWFWTAVIFTVLAMVYFAVIFYKKRKV